MTVGLTPKPSDEDVCHEIRRHRGRLYEAARALGVSSMYVRKRIREDETVQAAYRDSRDQVIDLAETVMYQRLQQGSETAAKYILSTLGKDRGYTERTEVVGKGGGAIKVTLSLGRTEMKFNDEVEEPEDYAEDELDSGNEVDMPDDLLEDENE